MTVRSTGSPPLFLFPNQVLRGKGSVLQGPLPLFVGLLVSEVDAILSRKVNGRGRRSGVLVLPSLRVPRTVPSSLVPPRNPPLVGGLRRLWGRSRSSDALSSKQRNKIPSYSGGHPDRRETLLPYTGTGPDPLLVSGSVAFRREGCGVGWGGVGWCGRVLLVRHPSLPTSFGLEGEPMPFPRTPTSLRRWKTRDPRLRPSPVRAAPRSPADRPTTRGTISDPSWCQISTRSLNSQDKRGPPGPDRYLVGVLPRLPFLRGSSRPDYLRHPCHVWMVGTDLKSYRPGHVGPGT